METTEIIITKQTWETIRTGRPGHIRIPTLAELHHELGDKFIKHVVRIQITKVTK